MYTALYRKYRPQNFEQVVGQTAITTALKNQVNTQRIGHAYLFTGTRGTGKTSCAKIFAKAINCLNPTEGEPCGVCDVCKGITDGSVFDVVEIDAASNNGVDDVRELREETAYVPAVCKYKVYIIDEVHMLSTSAFNALLKIMEEPPAHVIFILATTEIHKVPATILSRCQRFDFHRVQANLIAQHLLNVAQQEDIQLTEGAAVLIARLADGAVRDALSLLDTCITASGTEVDETTVRSVAGVADKAYLFEISSAIHAQNTAAVLTLVNEMLSQSVEVKRLTEELIYHYRNILLAGLSSTVEETLGTGAEYFAQYQTAAKEIPNSQIIIAIKTLGAALDKIGKGTDPRIELELSLFSLCEPTETIQPEKSKAQPQQTVTASQTQKVASTTNSLPESIQEAPAQETMPAKATTDVQEFTAWQTVIDKMEKKDKLLFAQMLNTTAYLQDKRVLIDGSEVFMEYMRQNDYSTALLKDIIEEVTGTRYAIGPYKRKEQTTEKQAEKKNSGLEKLEQNGVLIEYD